MKHRETNPIFNELSKSIMLENMFKERLEEEISNLKQSFNQLKKDLSETRKDLNVNHKKENKYKEVSYLSSSVQAQTEHVMISNVKDYREMARKQEETINNLKKYRNNIRREN